MRRPHASESGFTLVEVIVSVVLLTIVTGTLAMAFASAFDQSRPTAQRVRESTDAQLIAAFLIRDAQAAGGTNPLTAVVDPSLGVSAGGTATCGTGSPILQFTWLDRALTATTHKVAAYFFASGSHQLVRTTCVASGPPTSTTLGHSIANATGACSPACASDGSNSLPNTVSLTITATNDPHNAPNPYSYVLTANVRPQGQGPQNASNSTLIPLLALGGPGCNSGGAAGLALAGNAQVRVFGEVVVNAAGTSGCPAMTANGSVSYNPGGTEILNPGACTGGACPAYSGYSPPLSDPFAALPVPAIVPTGACPSGSNPIPTGGVYPSGVYPNLLSISGGNVTFQTGGTFVFCAGLQLNGNGTVSGTNVLLYFKGGTLQVSGGVGINFDDSARTGAYPGLLVWQPSSNATTMSIAGTADESWLGTIYAPAAEVDISGNAGTKVLTSIIARTLVITGNNAINIGTPPSNPLAITSPNSGTLPGWTRGIAYSPITIQTIGGSGVNTWTVIGLPPGLSLVPNSGTASAVLSGTPTTAGAYSVSITVRDNLGDQATKAYSLTIQPPPTITNPATLPSWDLGRDYPGSAVMTGSGGTPAYAWSATGLPPGITINSTTGVIAGNATATGTYTITVTLTDGAGATDTQTYTNVNINALPTITGPASLPNWTSGQAYPATTITKTGGTAPFVWAESGLPPGLSINAGTGVVGGTPTAAGSYSATITVTDAAGVTASHPYSLTINPAPSIGTVSLPNGEKNVPYSTTLAPGSGGTPPYTWSATGLPATLSLNSNTGVISGTPTAAATYSVTVTLTDSTNATASKTYSLVIQPPPSITGPPTLPSWTITRDYPGQTVTVVGGLTPYTWSASGLPPGLTINSSSGVISGTPTSTGTYSVTVNVIDAAGIAAPPASYSITINGLPSVSNPSLPSGEQSVAYASTTMIAGGGTAPYVWSGSGLPPGLSLTSTGVLSGTPTVGGNYSVTITATDAAGATATHTFAVSILPPPTVSGPTTLPNWTVNRPYPTTTLTGTGGTAPYTWTSTALPAGLTLNGSSGDVSGTPTAAGITSVTVTIHDAVGATTTQNYTIAINAAPAITTSSLPESTTGRPYSAALATSGGTAPFVWSDGGTLPSGLSINSATGAIAGTPGASGATAVTITATDSAGATATHSYTLTINAAPTITTAALPDAELSVAYSAAVSGSSGTTPYTWSATGLPGGLSISGAGVISGNPTSAGTFSVNLTLTDAWGAVATRTVTLIVHLHVTTPACNVKKSTAMGGFSLTSTGGSGPYTWTASGQPAWVSVSSAGLMTGTAPATTGPSTFTVSVTDSAGRTGSTTFTVTVTNGGPPAPIC